jgi:WD40 repeat protein
LGTFGLEKPLSVSEKQGNPYPGLRPFDQDDSALFFGRVQHVSDLLGRLTNNKFLAVVGVSGSGKSSLVRAGLIPVLRQGFLTSAGEHWRTILLRPGKAPLKALGTALGESFGKACDAENLLQDTCGGLLEMANRFLGLRENLLVVVDQFEEIFRYKHLTQNDSPDERISAVAEASAFVSLILNALANDRFHAIITMRSDYLGDCAQFHGLPEEINKGQYLIPRLSAEEQREIIVRPIWARQTKISELLVQRLLDDVGPEPEQLPVLQHLLSQVWQDWEKKGAVGPIGLQNLENVGGLNKAMDWHAEDVYRDLPSPLHRWVTKRLFQRITLKGTSQHPIRRAETVSDLQSVMSDNGNDAQANSVLLDVIGRLREKDVGFLTSPESGPIKPESVIDISHESLCWLWTRLRNWVEEEAESAELYSRVSKLAVLYKNQNKQDSQNKQDKEKQGLYPDPGLTYVLEKYRPGEKSQRDPDKIDPWCEEWSLAYNKSWAATKEYISRSKIRQRLKAAGRIGMFAIIAFCALLVTAIIFITEGKRADDFASQADFHRAQLGGSTQERAALLDFRSRNVQNRLSNSDLASWESFDRIVRGDLVGHLQGPVSHLFVLGDGHIVAVLQPPNWQQVPRPVAFRLNGSKAETLEDQEFLKSLSSITAISSSGRYAATTCIDGKAAIWDTAANNLRLLEISCTNSIASIAEPSVKPEGALNRFATVENLSKTRATVRVIDADSKRAFTTAWENIALMNEAISPDGHYIAIAEQTSSGFEVQVQSLPTAKKPLAIIKLVSDSAPLAFSRDGHFLAVGLNDGNVALYDFRKRAPEAESVLKVSRRSQVALFPISAIAFSNKAEPQLMAYSENGGDNTLRVVRLREVQGSVQGDLLWSDYFGKRVGQLVFSPLDTYLGLALDENTARVKIASTGFETARVTHTGRALSIVFDSKEQWAFSGSDTSDLLRFPTKAAKSTELVEFGCSVPQAVSVNDSGDVAAVSCAEIHEGSVTPTVQLFMTDGPSDHSTSVEPRVMKTKGAPFDPKDRGYLCHTSVSGDGSLVVAQCNEKIELYDARDAKSDSGWPVQGDFTAGSKDLMDSNDCQKVVQSVALNKTGSLLAVGDDCGRVITYDFDRVTGAKRRPGSVSPIKGSEIQSLLDVPTSRYLNVMPGFLKVRLGSRVSGHLSKMQNLPSKAWAITSLSFSPDSKTISVGTAFGTVWLASALEPSSRLWARQLDGAIGATQFSSDSQSLVVAAGGAAYILRAKEGEDMHHISELGDTFTAVAFAADGQRAAAGTLKGKAKILDLSFPGPTRIVEKVETWLSSATPAADATLSGLQTVFALQFVSVPSRDSSQESSVPILAIWASRDQILAPTDQDERDRSLALTHHDLDIDRRAQGVCDRLREDLVVPPDLSYGSVCGSKLAGASKVATSKQ